MAAVRYTSRVFAFGRALFEALAGASWPAHPTTQVKPVVQFSDENPEGQLESVSVRLTVDTDEMSWVRLSPPGKDELVRFDVVARSMVPLQTSAEVWDRLDVLAEVAQLIVFDTVAAQVVPLGVDGEVLHGLAVSVRPEVFPGGGGWVGGVVVTYEFQGRI